MAGGNGWGCDVSVPLRVRLADVDEVTSVCEATVDFLRDDGFTMPSVYLLRGGRLRCEASRGYWQIVDGFPPGVGVMGQVVASGEPVVIDDTQDHPEFVAAVGGVRGEAGAPILVDGEVVGVLNIETQTALPPDTEARIVAHAAVVAARLEQLGGVPVAPPAEQLAHHVIALAGLRDTTEITERTLQAAVQLSGMASAVLARRGTHSQLLVRGVVGPLDDTAHGWTPDDLETIDVLVAHGASSYFAGDQATSAKASPLLSDEVAAVIVLPLVTRGSHDGFLLVADRVVRRTDTSLVRRLEQLAIQASTMAATTELIEELGERATRDPLTGLGNAAAFTAHQAVLHAEHPGLIAALMIDIDRFKQVNDTLGHLEGDRLLRAGATALHAALRRSDRLFRIGGDEFAALIPVESHEEATVIADRLLRAARATGELTVSIGVASTHASELSTATRARADAALYRAKHRGRDTVVALASTVEPDPDPFDGGRARELGRVVER